MVEVFKTNVTDRAEAEALLHLLHSSFVYLDANFDLEDCDRILRVDDRDTALAPEKIIHLLESKGYMAEVLPDRVPEPRVILDY